MIAKLTIASLLSIICAAPCLPCDCPTKRTVQDELDASSAVFSGKVVQKHWFDKETENFHGKRIQSSIIIVTVQVSKTWKGEVGSQVEVETADPEFNICGFDFQKEQEYLVYAVKKKQRLETDVCSRTKLLSAASEDLQALGGSH